MQSLRLDKTISLTKNLEQFLDINDSIINVFEVIPLDYRIVDYTSPRFYISKSKLFFVFDEVIEIFELKELEIGIMGNKPIFDVVPLVFEGTFVYAFENSRQIEKFKSNEALTRLSINEVGHVPKYFLLRSGLQSQKSIKTWAFTQVLRNIQLGKVENPDLIEITKGYFSSFNQKTVLYFIFSFLVYVVLKLLGGLLPTIVSTIFDVVFGVILVLLAYWTYISVKRNLQRYKNIYISYSPPN